MSQVPVLEPEELFVEGLEALSHADGDAPVREDSALCMTCMRWATEGHECRKIYRCDEGIEETGQPQPHF